EVWNVSPSGKTDEQIAEEGLQEMEKWMRRIGVAMSLSELGATEDMIDGIADATFILEGGYKVLTKDEVKQILKESL
ncbi:MAG: iron-containing alcohol dehydrogenase, partial [Clostridiales bacterium]|nr:iron-containing alcohol dehydrogenase [Clostridiales bacterium]